MNKLLLLSLMFATGLATNSCKKDEITTSEGGGTEELTEENCDISIYTGDWNFIVNEDSETQYLGVIHKYNDSILNVHYQEQDLMQASDNYFKQIQVESCVDGVFLSVTIPHGNTGGWTKKEGTITTTTFDYIETSRYVDYVTGEESFGEKTIKGTKVE